MVTADPERRELARSRYPGARLYADPEAFYEDLERFDLVVVGTPNDSHVAHAMRCIEMGVPVVVDKPLAVSSDAALKLVAAASEARSFLTVFQNRRWDGDFLALRHIVDSAVLGRLFRLESRFQAWAPAVADRWREDPAPELGGGVLVDLGVHLMDQVVQLFGPVSSVYAEVSAFRPGARVDDDAFISLTHESGIVSHLSASRAVAAPEARFHLSGERGSYVKLGLDVQEQQLRSGLTPRSEGWGVAEPPVTAELTLEDEVRSCAVGPGRYQAFYEGVRRSLCDGDAPPVDPLDAVYTLQLIEAARVSASSGRTVRPAVSEASAGLPAGAGERG